MNKRQGFTLVELLAVIVVLAIIMVIAIPNVIKVIDKAKLNTYKRNEDMLVNATQKYMASNGINLNVGQTTSITYSQLQNDKLIDKITDQTSKGECSNSKVIVTKTSSGYTYKPGLVCDNYISIDTFNLLSNGDFSSGATGWNAVNGSGTALNSIYNLTGGTTGPTYFAIFGNTSTTIVQGHKIYVRAKTKLTSGLGCTSIQIKINGTVTNNDIIAVQQTSPIQNTLYDLSGILTLPASPPSGNIQVQVRAYCTDISSKTMEIQNVIVLELNDLVLDTKTAVDIDNLINKSK